MPPNFSIITPMYNRERFITRSISSCLKQDFTDFEIVVVDDGSTDKSVEMVKKIRDSRVKLITLIQNKGGGFARNTAVAAASGAWVILLDSDDELAPGALSIIHSRCAGVDKSIARLNFMGRMDNGELSVDPPLQEEQWDYISFIRWMENCLGGWKEIFWIARRATFAKCKFYNLKAGLGPYHLDFMKQFNAKSFPDVTGLFHQDAGNQVTKANARLILANAPEQISCAEWTIKAHGTALEKFAPRTYQKFFSGLVTHCFIGGLRKKGLGYAREYIARYGLNPMILAIAVAGLLGKRILIGLKISRRRVSRQGSWRPPFPTPSGRP